MTNGVVFRAVRLRNFKSHGNKPTEFRFNPGELVRIMGRNGSGKSSIIDALFFGIYGRSLHDVKRDELVNTVNRKMCEVEVDFSRGETLYTVSRGVKPSFLRLSADGEPLEGLSSAREEQERILRLVGVSPHTFRSVVAVSEDRTQRFMELPAADRRRVVEELLNIRVLSGMSDSIRAGASNIRAKIASLEAKIAGAEREMEAERRNLEAARAVAADQRRARARAIETAERDAAEVQRRIAELEAALSKMSETPVDARDLLREAVSAARREVEEISSAVAEETSNVSAAKAKVEGLKRAVADAEKRLKKLREAAERDDVSELERELRGAREAAAEIPALREAEAAAKKSVDSLSERVENLRISLAEAERVASLVEAGMCPMCGRECDEEFAEGIGDPAVLRAELEKTQQRLSDARADLTNLRKKLARAEEVEKSVARLESMISDAEKAAELAAVELEEAEEELEELRDELQTAAEKGLVAERNRRSLAATLEEKKSALEEAERSLREAEEIAASRAKLESELAAAKSAAAEVAKRLEDAKSMPEPRDPDPTRFRELQTEIEKTKVELEKALDAEEHAKFARKILSDDGVRAYIVSAYLPFINSRVREYLEELDLNVGFEFDETFDLSFRDRGRDPLSFNAFSAGQRARINFAISLAFSDLARAKLTAPASLLFLDEVLDSHLDDDGCADVLRLLKRKAERDGVTVCVISHRTIALDGFDREYLVERRGGFTQVTEV